MFPFRETLSENLADQTYIELVRTLFGALRPTVIMSVLFVGVASMAAAVTDDVLLTTLGLGGTALSALRVGVVLRYRRKIESAVINRPCAADYERWFGVPYLAFAVVLGLFGARALVVAPVELHMVMVALLVGYAAGVAAGVSLRPWIGAPSMIVAVMPTVIVALVTPDVFHVALGIVMAALLVGGIGSMVARYRAEVEKTEMRRVVNGLARRDHLTGLANRLGLSEHFERSTADRHAGCLIAIHCLDLDRFKPVNDLYGHPTGDELLRLVAQRLENSLRRGDLAARVGGDEFVVIQSSLNHRDEAELMALRLGDTLGEPYLVGDDEIRVGMSVGYVVSDCTDHLDDLIGKADNVLYGIKRIGGGAAGYSDAMIEKAFVRRSYAR